MSHIYIYAPPSAAIADLKYNDTLNDIRYGQVVPDNETLDRERELREQLEDVAHNIDMFLVNVGYEILDPRWELLEQFANKYFTNINAEDFFVSLECARNRGNASSSLTDHGSTFAHATPNATDSRLIEQAEKRFMDLHLFGKFHDGISDHERNYAPNAIDLQLRNGSVVTLRKDQRHGPNKDVPSWEVANIDQDTCTSTFLVPPLSCAAYAHVMRNPHAQKSILLHCLCCGLLFIFSCFIISCCSF